MNIYHFYHIWADGEWQIPLDEHIEVLYRSHLYEVLNIFSIGLIGSKDNREHVKTYLKNRGIEFEICVEADEGFEQKTLEQIIRSDFEDGYVLYAHTKGSYTSNQANTNWRRNLTSRLVFEWINNIDLLKTHSAVGSRYYTLVDEIEDDVKEIYSLPLSSFECTPASIVSRKGVFLGNFWWSHLRYLKQLDIPESDNRFKAEHILFNLKDVVTDKDFTVFDKNPYFSLDYFKGKKGTGKFSDHNSDFGNVHQRLWPDIFGGWTSG
jgi:hypothetical protein